MHDDRNCDGNRYDGDFVVNPWFITCVCFGELPLTAMLNLVRAFTGAPASTFYCLSLPTDSLLVSAIFSLFSVLTRTILPALPIFRHSDHSRCHLPPPRPYASLFSSLSWPGPRERAYHVPRS